MPITSMHTTKIISNTQYTTTFGVQIWSMLLNCDTYMLVCANQEQYFQASTPKYNARSALLSSTDRSLCPWSANTGPNAGDLRPLKFPWRGQAGNHWTIFKGILN